MGKFARVCLKTKYIDYNGRLCMVSAGAANKKAFGIDRSANPWDDILNADVVLIAGSNTAECSPITTNYVWQARENGGKLIGVGPRITPIARTEPSSARRTVRADASTGRRPISFPPGGISRIPRIENTSPACGA